MQQERVKDVFGRPLRDLRISVTDRCNFRCVYCMPKEVFGSDYQFMERSQLLTFEEITRTVAIFKRLGVEKVRLTGGEPLLRRNLDRLIMLLSSLGDLDIALTTNGSALKQLAPRLKEAGLKRVTVSLDSLDDRVFMAMNDVRFPVHRVLEGIEAAARAGLKPVKINMVVKRGTNDQDVVPMARFFRDRGHIVRFIEYMDVGNSNGWRMDEVVTADEIVAKISDEMPLEPIPPNYPGEVATRYRYRDGSGEIGVIASVTKPFCGACSRARLSAEGKLYTCLFASSGFDLRALLRTGKSDEEIFSSLCELWRVRDDRYSELRSQDTKGVPKIEMSYIGG